MDRAEAIVWLTQYVENGYCRNAFKDALEMAIAALREQVVQSSKEDDCERDQRCECCKFPDKYLHTIDCTEPRIFLQVYDSGIIQVFNEEYPGWIDSFKISYCPKCGRKLGGAEG